MQKNNLFFRGLVIAATTVYENLIHDGKHIDLLRDQVENLSEELDTSPHGVLEDYPDECYPIDVFAAIAFIKRADSTLGTDHSRFLDRARMGFQGYMLDKRGLIPYLVDAGTGAQYGPSRGVGNSWILIFAPELWPDLAGPWYELYIKHFWQDLWWTSGFREFPKDLDGFDWTYDVDAGPIIAGFSPAANAFGIGAAKVNGRLDHAYTLSAQAIAACWPLSNGGMLGPKILSSISHAPYLGEVCMLYFLSQQPDGNVKLVTGGTLPLCVYIGLFINLLFILAILYFVSMRIKRWGNNWKNYSIPEEKLQFVTWVIMMCGSLILFHNRPFHADDITTFSCPISSRKKTAKHLNPSTVHSLLFTA